MSWKIAPGNMLGALRQAASALQKRTSRHDGEARFVERSDRWGLFEQHPCDHRCPTLAVSGIWRWTARTWRCSRRCRCGHARSLALAGHHRHPNMPFDQKELVGTGAYLVVTLNCGNCHGATAATFLSGGRMFGTTTNPIYARNLTPDATNGMKPGRRLSSSRPCAPVKTCRQRPDAGHAVHHLSLDDDYDLQAIYAYPAAIPAVANPVMPDMKAAPGSPTASPTAYADGRSRARCPPTTPSIRLVNYAVRGCRCWMIRPTSRCLATPTSASLGAALT